MLWCSVYKYYKKELAIIKFINLNLFCYQLKIVFSKMKVGSQNVADLFNQVYLDELG